MSASILRHIVNHLGASGASKLVPLASIFIFSRMMTVPDYGTVSVFTSYLWIFGIALSINLYTSVGRLIYEPDLVVGRLLGTTFTAIAVCFSVGSLLIVWRLDDAASLLRLPPLAVGLLLVVVAGQIAESLFTQIAISEQRSALLARVIGGRAIATLIASLVLIGSLETDRFLGVIVADAATSVVLIVFVGLRYRPVVVWGIDRALLARMARYAVPLIPYQLSLTLLAQFDRIQIDRAFGREAAGLYSMAFNLGMLLSVVITAVLNAFNPRFFEAMNAMDHDRVRRESRAVLAVAVALAAVVVTLGPPGAAIVLPARYATCFPWIPAIAVGALALTVFQVWARVIGFAHMSWLISAITVVATLVKVGLNALFLETVGIEVAAWTTVAAYVTMWVLCVVGVNRIVGLLRVRLIDDLVWIGSLLIATVALDAVSPGGAAGVALRVVTLMAFLVALKGPLLSLRQGGSAA